jgi:hypothetical protein
MEVVVGEISEQVHLLGSTLSPCAFALSNALRTTTQGTYTETIERNRKHALSFVPDR